MACWQNYLFCELQKVSGSRVQALASPVRSLCIYLAYLLPIFVTEANIRFLPPLLYCSCRAAVQGTGVYSGEKNILTILKLGSGKKMPFVHTCLNDSKWRSAPALQFCLHYGGNAQLKIAWGSHWSNACIWRGILFCWWWCSTQQFSVLMHREICASLVLAKFELLANVSTTAQPVLQLPLGLAVSLRLLPRCAQMPV